MEWYGLENGVSVAWLSDNRKLFRLLPKETITRERINEMVRNINGMPVKAIKDRLIGWKEFFEARLNQAAPFVILNSWFVRTICLHLRTANKRRSIIYKLKASKTPCEDGLRAEPSNLFIIVHNSPSENALSGLEEKNNTTVVLIRYLR